ncbi:MFS transporter [Paenibacillus flagellatus]|uniref:Antiporter n=1 Tax=Paenibacillus flagellatus TaxID=2211139 RepID=A0A2V5K9Y1_9BACL|nr:MFS transporter [Paenibacillus flagellatus]PYI55702.1 antiporter [Paenibacillus flagellatus]
MESEARVREGEKLIRVLAFTLVISVMSATMFNIVLPEIGKQFELTLSQVSWVSSAFLLVYAIGTVTYGKLADTYKLKNLITFGLVFFAAGSLVGLAAPNYGTVLIGRVLQAVGAAVIPATAAIIPVRYFPPEKRGRALGIAMTGLAIGSALGPVVAALVVGVAHWRWLFAMPLFTLLALPYYRRYLREEERKAGAIDWLGGALLAGTVSLLLLAVTYGKWLPAVGAIAAFVLFVSRIRAAKEPFIRPALFSSKAYALGLAIAFVATAIGYSLVFLTPQLLAGVHRLEPGLVGFVMFPAAVATALLGRTGGKLADAKGNSVLFYAATAMLVVCFALMTSFTGAPPAFIALFLLFGNVGQSFLYIALSNAISRTLPKEHSGVGMGLLSMLNFIAGAVAAAVYGKIVDDGAGFRLNPAISRPEAYVYSNLYIVLALLLAFMAMLYYVIFGRTDRDDKKRIRRRGRS